MLPQATSDGEADWLRVRYPKTSTQVYTRLTHRDFFVSGNKVEIGLPFGHLGSYGMPSYLGESGWQMVGKKPPKWSQGHADAMRSLPVGSWLVAPT